MIGDEEEKDVVVVDDRLLALVAEIFVEAVVVNVELVGVELLVVNVELIGVELVVINAELVDGAELVVVV